MIGIVTKFAALDILRSRLSASPDPAHRTLGTLIDTHLAYAYFGALGTSYGDFSPVRLAETGVLGDPGANPYVLIWKLIFNIFGGDETSGNPGLKPVLDRIRNLLARLDTIAAAEDLSALQAMSSEVDTLNQIAADLNAVLIRIKGDGTLSNLGIVPTIGELIGNVSKPAIVKPRVDGNVGFPPVFWTLRDLLSWRRSGRFAQTLWDQAAASGNDELRAYALGWLSSWSLCTSGASAVASIIGAPYRNQWWRARFVSNYIDLWAHGYAEVGPEPAPYAGWPNLCERELQRRIQLPGAALDADDVMKSLRLGNPLTTALPTQFTDYWTRCYESVYGDFGLDRPLVTADTLQDAYGLAWLVLWFQTSAESLGCQSVMPTAPTDCGSAPSWSDPTVPGDAGGGVGGPPAPAVDRELKPGNVICAILLAIAGVALICVGGYAAGAAAIGGAIALAATAGTIDWAKLRCDIAWYHLYLYNGLRALHDLMSLGGFVHPYTFELSQDMTAFSLLRDVPITFRTGDHIVKSRVRENFPVVPWSGGGILDWLNDPTGDLERPPTLAARASVYPSAWIDDPTNPLGNKSPFADGPWPFETDPHGPVGFMNSTDALLDWLHSPGTGLPDWNLDGDRGLGFHTWVFHGTGGVPPGLWTNPVNIDPET